MKPYYEDSTVTIYCGDALEVIPTLGHSDCLITDPPFSFAGGLSNGRTSIADDQFFSHWWRAVCERISANLHDEAEGFVWCDWKTARVLADGFSRPDQVKPFRISQMLYHHREMPGQGQPFRSSVDMIAYLRGPKSHGKRIPNTTMNFVSKYWYYGRHKFHPAEKSVEVSKQLVEWASDPAATILDPFLGSGTTAVAAKELGRQLVGIEVDERHCETAANRARTTNPLPFGLDPIRDPSDNEELQHNRRVMAEGAIEERA